MPLEAGSHLGPYEVIAALGAGGMGEVYRARDGRLGRDVAIKVLPAHFAAHPDRLRRFDEEARAIAGLNHPHICQIHDVGPGYLVLEYIEGSPPHGPLAADEAVRLSLQIVSALEAAHQRRILHRDLKPANILVTPNGTVKLLDFGLAKLMAGGEDALRTMDGTVLGTAGYMSPEQALGRPVDQRSDIFSFGVVLYELLSGNRAFDGATSAVVLHAVVHETPTTVRAPAALEQIVQRCLAKRPADRFQTMADVRIALERLANPRDARPEENRQSIAVLPFANMSADPENEYFSDGLAEEIINALTQIAGLKVIARTSAFAFKGKNEDIRRIAEVLGVAHVLEGSVRKSGNRIRVTAQLITAADGSHLWSQRYDREMADVFAIQDEIAAAIAQALQVTLAVKPAIARHKPTLPAFEAVLKGRHHLIKHTHASFARANDYFEQAMALDPQYADAHAHLGLNHLFAAMMAGVRSMREATPLIRAEANDALQLDPSDPSPHFLLATVAAAYEYDWPKAVEHFAIAMTSANPSAEAHWAYASFYLQPLGRFAEGIAAMERAVERDPLNAVWRGVLASHLTHAQRYEEAARQAREAIDLDDSNGLPYVTLGEAYVTQGRWEEALPVLEKACQLMPGDAQCIGLLAGALANLGERARADTMIREMSETQRPLIGRVLYYWLCAEDEQAAAWYERAINARDPFALVYADGPLGRAFRQSPHWAALAKTMRLQAGAALSSPA